MQLEWIAEWARLLADGGTFRASVHSESVWRNHSARRK
jgi:hypothetical protein